MSTENSFNQTNFSQDRPRYEDELRSPEPEEVEDELPPAGPVPVYKRKIVWVLVGAGVFLLILGLLLFFADNSDQPTSEETVKENEQMQENNDPFLRRINQLEQELDAADPTKPELIFPPVKMDIYLDQPE